MKAYQVTIQPDRDAPPQVLWSGLDKVEAWWQFVNYVILGKCMALPSVMEMFREEFFAMERGQFCNGYELLVFDC